MQRGQFVTVAVPGATGKPRPALVVQNDVFGDLPSVVVCPLTATLRADADLLRIMVEPSAINGLRQPSQIVIDKITTVPVDKVGVVIGAAEDGLLVRIDRALAPAWPRLA